MNAATTHGDFIAEVDAAEMAGLIVRQELTYIDPPTIPAGMTIETYRKVRSLNRKPRGIRRISSRAMVI